jgi:DNA repair protein RecO (recombination protein O)
MTETATGLVLRTRPLTETSLIVCWLTPDLGRLATVAKGARRPKSPYRGKLDLFYLADFSFTRSRRSELHTLREVGLRETHRQLRQDLVYLQQAAYAAALVEQTTETETPLPAIFELLSELLKELPKRPAEPQTVLGFELRLLEELGLQPDIDQAKLSPGARLLAKELAMPDRHEVAQLQPGTQIKELSRFLSAFLLHHLGRIPKGRDAALAARA